MSAYIVDSDTIDRIATHINEALAGERPDGIYGEVCRSANSYQAERCGWENSTELGQAMWNLNTESVNLRYRRNDPAPDYTFRPRHTNPLRVYRSLEVYLYQSCEEGCDKHPLYLALEKLQAKLAERIVKALPEYEASDWS